jgi:hypothetical protein
VLPVVIGLGISVAGVQVTMLGLTATGTALTAGLWLAMRGDGRDPVLKAPPSVWASTVGAFRQVVGTPWGLVRLLVSPHLLTVLTGLYAAALGGQMIDQMVLLNDPTQAFGTTALAVSALVAVRGLVTIYAGRKAKDLEGLLGTPGAIAKAFGRAVEVGELDEGLALRRVLSLPLVLAIPVGWLVLTPGLLPFGLLLIGANVMGAWTRQSLDGWFSGTTAAALNSTAKAAGIALGAAVSAAVLGGHSTLVSERVAAGQPYGEVVDAATLMLALLAVPVVVVPASVAPLTVRLRLARLPALGKAMETTGVDPDTRTKIVDALTVSGIHDVGSARALFLHPDWTPRRARSWQLAAREARRESIGLTPAQRDILTTALHSFDRSSGGDNGSGHELRQVASRVIARLRRLAPPARTALRS